MPSQTTWSRAIAVIVTALALGACTKTPEPGPAEQAGKQLDQAMQKAAAAAKVAAEKAGETMQKAGKEMQDAAKK